MRLSVIELLHRGRQPTFLAGRTVFSRSHKNAHVEALKS